MDPSQHTPFPRPDVEGSVVDRFEKIASQFGDRIAVKYQARSLTYAELNAAANRVAGMLLSRDGGAAEPVGLLLDKDEQTVSAMLGVLKAGKFYVPLDVSYPADRLSLIVNECKPGVIVANRTHIAQARSLAPQGTQVIDVIDLHQGHSENNPRANVSPDSLAAVFFTSGSTGRAKGVMQSHRVLLHRVMVGTNALRVTPADRLALFASASYSASIRQLFGGLLNGAMLCPCSVVREGIASLPEWLAQQEITIYSSVPAVFRQLAAILTGSDRFDALRVVQIGGERVTPADFELYKRFFSPQCRFVTSFGSNETGLMRMYVADHSTRLPGGVVPVGYEIDDKHVAILDDDGTELAANTVGEIVVKSAFLAPGYWNQPELTAAAFPPDPEHPGRRVYRTGDLGAMLPDGCLTYKGRKDSRVKIRGVRVETDEVEGSLRLHPGVAQAAVVASAGSSGPLRLVAYIVRHQSSGATVSELRAFLSSRLPPASIPAAFVFMETLPQTPNGKLDRRILPPPTAARPELDAAFVAPRNASERRLTHLCEETLGIRPIGSRDNLFDLGIDSLTLLLLTARIEDDFDTHLPPATLFAHPTIAQLADLLMKNDLPHSWSSLLPIQTEGTRPPFFLIHGDGSFIFLSRYLGPDWPIYGLEHQSQDGRPVTYRLLADIAAYYLREIRRVQSQGPYFLGGYSFGGIVAFEVAQQLRQQGDQVKLLALLDPPSLLHDKSARLALTTGATHAPLHREFNRHRARVASLSVRELVADLWPRVTGRLRCILGIPTIVKAWQTLVYRTYLAAGRRMPVFVRPRYIQDVYLSAREGYEPRPYDGRAILFNTPERRYAAATDWGTMMTGELSVHIIDATHAEIREEAFVPMWAERLKAALSECHDEAGAPPII